ncbi:MAG: NrfD/PsrC family molybdoenzyme membrane anchor subunit [Candidatus Dormibacterales bacterium]
MSSRHPAAPAGTASSNGRATYYGQPILKPPVWKPEVGWYLFAGGMAGASGLLAAVARARGNGGLAVSARAGALAGSIASPLLLISDLGRPERFLHMLRVIKPTSPMSMGSWILAGFGTATGAAAAGEWLGLARPLGRMGGWAAAALGPALATYTSVLLTDTAVPVWHRARRLLPFVFAGGAAASAGAFAAIFTDPRDAAPARRMAVLGTAAELAAAVAMESRLGEYAEPLRQRPASTLRMLAAGLSLPGAALLATAGRRSRAAAATGGLLVLGGALAERFAVFRAGFASAAATTDSRRASIR